MANNKEPYILITHYQSLYKTKYGKVPAINKFREKWGMQDIGHTSIYCRRWVQ